jgi:hypothetical protein
MGGADFGETIAEMIPEQIVHRNEPRILTSTVRPQVAAGGCIVTTSGKCLTEAGNYRSIRLETM